MALVGANEGITVLRLSRMMQGKVHGSAWESMGCEGLDWSGARAKSDSGGREKARYSCMQIQFSHQILEIRLAAYSLFHR